MMTQTAPAPASFDLLVTASGEGPTHLRAEGHTGILCGDYRRRYSTFRIVGIVPARTSNGRAVATCAACTAAADAL